jgi:hypothetical protein
MTGWNGMYKASISQMVVLVMNISRYLKHYLLNVLTTDCIQQTSYRNSNICIVDKNIFRIENRYNKSEIILYANCLTWNVLRSEIYTVLPLKYYLKGQTKILSNKHNFNNLICSDLPRPCLIVVEFQCITHHAIITPLERLYYTGRYHLYFYIPGCLWV